jgi:hypothetical protein
MTKQPNANADTDNIAREVQAALGARQELGPAYDEHLAQALAEKLVAQVHRELAAVPKPTPSGLSRDQRTGLAICSLIFLIPLVAILGGMFGGWGAAGAIAAVLALNLLARV